MADPLYELLAPYFHSSKPETQAPKAIDGTTGKYLNRLSTLPLSALSSSEDDSLAQSSHTNLLSLQALSARSNAAIVLSADHHSNLSENLPKVVEKSEVLRHDVPKLDEEAVGFSGKYSRSTENEILNKRKMALLMARNVDRLSDILDLPTLLSSTISFSTLQGASNANSFASALDLHSHIKRLHLFYQDSQLVALIYQQTDEAMQEMTSNLIASLKLQNIKLAAGMRTIGWLRRIVPELDASLNNKEGNLGALFLVCRLATLTSTLAALEPLSDLADQETALRERDGKLSRPSTTKDYWTQGQQTEKYLKRYIEIFREQSFAIISMYRSIFPSAHEAAAYNRSALNVKTPGLQSIDSIRMGNESQISASFSTLPSALATFPMHLIDLLSSTLKQYLPNLRDKSSRESLLTQVLYCAGSLGRLGGDFSMQLATLAIDIEDDDEDDDTETQWITVMKKHRELAKKLEKMASGAS
ncbi:uncharacterized protein KY384_007169 [Bacidia gigantensis]|uniref:uncharacterized protein n=1 Tax=Bacidia gigantensis TaxID=2732470 RepID=UPI001D0527A5|nr:uncharacterized protein KY384_007169 [Bacidia gigantensis]KAG8528252.1 hypothetical protein KY384_007169 [Bacidia gigantensis]